MVKRKFDFDLIVLGSGAGGSAAANIASKAGLNVAVVENDLFGGESPNYSDIPLAAISKVEKTFFEAKRIEKMGLRSANLTYNFPMISNWRKLAVERTGAHDNQKFFESLGITTFRGEARFLTPNEISINQKHYSAKNFLIATGSKVSIPDVKNIENVRYYTPKTIFEISRPPRSIFIIGGGSEAVEIAQFLAIFGTKVYISEVSARILPKEDEEVGITLENILVEEHHVYVLPQTRVLAVQKDGLMKRVIFQRGGAEKFVRVDEILVVGERTPNTDIGLENAHVEYSKDGILVNEFVQTSMKHIFAVGGVVNPQMQTSEILLSSRTVAHNILHPRSKMVVNFPLAPRTISTWPEIASVGLSEDDCLKRDLKYKTAIAPLNLIAKSNIENFSNGFVKLICDKKGKIIGGSVVAPDASNIIAQISLAIRNEMTARELAEIPQPFLSWSEIIRVAAHRIR